MATEGRDRRSTPVGGADADYITGRPRIGINPSDVMGHILRQEALAAALADAGPTSTATEPDIIALPADDDIEIIIDVDEPIAVGSAADTTESTAVVPPPFVKRMAAESKLGHVTPPPRTKTPIPPRAPSLPPPPAARPVPAPPTYQEGYDQAVKDIEATLIEAISMMPQAARFYTDLARARERAR